jgi:hypothetical protein
LRSIDLALAMCGARQPAALRGQSLTAFEPAALARDLQSMGFSVIEDAAPDVLNARYFSGRTDRLRLGGLAHMMWAGC